MFHLSQHGKLHAVRPSHAAIAPVVDDLRRDAHVAADFRHAAESFDEGIMHRAGQSIRTVYGVKRKLCIALRDSDMHADAMSGSRGVSSELIAIGARLAAAREAVGRSQAEVCRAIGVSAGTWNHWEKGRRKQDMIALIRFANLYDVPLDWILQGRTGNLSQKLFAKLLPQETG